SAGGTDPDRVGGATSADPRFRQRPPPRAALPPFILVTLSLFQGPSYGTRGFRRRAECRPIDLAARAASDRPVKARGEMGLNEFRVTGWFTVTGWGRSGARAHGPSSGC